MGMGSAMKCRQADTEEDASAAIPRSSPSRNSKIMKKILIGLCALGVGAGLVPKISAQTITITVGPATDDSYWVWNDRYQVWVWNGPEFQGDYQGHPYSYWHGRHEGGGDRHHHPGKSQSSEAERPVNKDNTEQPKAEQPRVEIDRSQAAQPQPEAEKQKERQPKTEVEKSKAERPKPEEKKEDPKPKGE
jgi:hypothetical protein